MDLSIGARWEKFVETAVQEGRYNSASDVVREGLRLVEERELKRAALKTSLEAALERGGALTDGEIDVSLERAVEALRREGY